MTKAASSVEIHKLKKELEVLEQKKGKGTELVSLYIPPKKKIYDVISQMRDEYSQASNIKSARTRKNVQSALEIIMQRLKTIKEVPENGIVMFVGTIPRGTKDKMEIYMINPPEEVVTYIYHCNSQFYLDTIRDMLSEKGTYGLLVVDRSEATIGFLKGKRVEIAKHINSNVPRKHGRGGQSQRRFERLIEIAAHEYFKKVGEQASNVFMNTPDLKGVLLGGPGPTKEFFYNEGYLHHEIQKKIIDVIDTSYTDEFGITELVDNAKELFRDLDVTKEKNLVQRFLKEVVKDNGLAAYGETEIRQCLTKGAVDTLLVSEDVESFRVVITCSSCDYRTDKTVKNVKEYENTLSTKKCPSCGEMGLGVDEFKSTLDEFTEMVDSTGARIEVISSETEEGQQLKAFGGLAAILRYRS